MIKQTLALIGLTVSLGANAAVTSFTDKGLDFTINDDDTSAVQITFADFYYSPTVIISQQPAPQTVIVDVQYQPWPQPPITIEKEFTFAITGTSYSGGFVEGFTSDIGPDNSSYDPAFGTICREGGDGLPQPCASPFTLNVDWSFAGPTETSVGTETFELIPFIEGRWDSIAGKYIYGPDRIDASNFPDSVTLNDDIDWQFFNQTLDFETGITDGANGLASISARYQCGVPGCDGLPDDDYLSVSSYFQVDVLPPSEVPIPAAAWLFGSALLGLGVVKRKKTQSKEALC